MSISSRAPAFNRGCYAFSPSRSLLVATTNAIHRVDVGILRLSGFLNTDGMNAEIIAVGSEMLTAGRLDTNSLFIGCGK